MEVTWLVAPDADRMLAELFLNLWSRTRAKDQEILFDQNTALSSSMLAQTRLVLGMKDAVAGAKLLLLAAYRRGLLA